MQEPLTTQRLQLIPLRRHLLEAFNSHRADFARLLAVNVPAEWPVAPELIPSVLRRLDASPQTAQWLPWAIVDRHSASLAGDAGFKGAPDDQGCCEIGYSVIPSFRRRGFATEAVAAIIAWVKLIPSVRMVRAEAPLSNLPSQRVLEKNGFVFAGGYDHPEDGPMRRYELGLITGVVP